jgi:PAS domain-containing protein
MKASDRRAKKPVRNRGAASRSARRSALAPLLDRVVVWEWDAARDRVIASPTLPAVYGVTAIERVSQGMVLVHPDDIDRHQARVHEAVERGRGYHSSFRIIQPNSGQSVAIEERAEAIPRRAALPPLLIGAAFDVTMRRGGGKSFADSLDALQRFCDQMLTRYATHLRTQPRAADTVDVGHWIDGASEHLSRLSRVPVSSVRAVPKLLADAIAALHSPHHAA